MTTTTTDDLPWLIEHSMLHSANVMATRYSGQGRMWQHPYAAAQPRAAAALASVWFTAYPPAIITKEGESVLATLGDPALWATFAAIGIRGIHTGPMKLSGGLQGVEFTPTIDGYFDRIGQTIDPAFGATEEFVTMSRNAAAQHAIVIEDIIPGHTGKGPDFRLAERNYGEYPGIYHMVAIALEDWPLLPPVPEGQDAVNLAPATVDTLAARGYIVGPLSRTIFYAPGVKETDWSATGVVNGLDGVARRWVYLHYFKAGQPTLNWLDPSFAGPRLVIGDALHALDVLGARMLRLDANGFLGVERRAQGPAWSEGHPLSLTANQIIGGMVRKAGGFTFQELNLTVDDIAAMSQGGANLSYDFITRPACQHALVMGDASFLRLMLQIMHQQGIDPAALVHALQNHDELTLELVHFWTLHKDDLFDYQGRQLRGSALRELIRAEMYDRLTGAKAPYNLPFVTNGVASTSASIAAAALGIRDLTTLSLEQRQQIQRAHLLLAMYNALQPGVFALSGWDLVGALPLPQAAVDQLMGDGDTRWIHRGAYDLMGVNPGAGVSVGGLPRAAALYGPVAAQLQEPESFASQLRAILAVREQCRLYAARQIAVPGVQNPGLLVMVHELHENQGIQITALNFGVEPVDEWVRIEGLRPGVMVDMFTESVADPISANGECHFVLEGHAGGSYSIR